MSEAVSNGAMRQTIDAVLKIGGTTVNSCGGQATANGVGQVTVNAGNAAGGMDAVTKAGAVAAAAYFTYKIGTDLYDRYVAKDDSPLIEKLTAEDCGGLSTMPLKIEGCYRKYARDAIYRTAQKAPWEMTKELYGRFHQCFDKRPVHDCSRWGEDVFNY